MASFLISDVRIFDGEQSIENGSVLVENGKISKVSSGAIQFEGTKYSKPGHTVLPGFIDTHIHANGGTEKALPQSLRFGCTTVCDMHNEWPNILKLKKQQAAGDCADLKTTSFAATIDNGWPMPILLTHADSPQTRAELATWPKLETADDAVSYVNDRVKEGVDYIKLMHESGTVMNQTFRKPSIELQKAVIHEAHKHGLTVVAHALSLDDAIEILEAGVDGTTHTIVDQAPNQRLIDAYKKSNAHCNPTLATLGSATSEGKSQQEKYAHDPRIEGLLGKEERDRMCQCSAFAQGNGQACEHAYESVRQMKAAGIPVLLGTDTAGPAVGTAWGLTAHQELVILVEKCGFTPEEALVAATSLPAKRFQFSDRGNIKHGLRADLLLVQGNPLENIDDTLNIRGVWTQGQLCSSYQDNL
ncbi:uncharacterized protein MYCFIDRAFT_61344 [Pseudocercospora fijiensis CIRAD86]|uniref:SWIM-type domain-containing protein n=1 Tax=Pseudocercospora fijiensis (strain CIRAD86) TaxID=383855 RepID=M3AQ33_PSEFD|nr:uncharacterized protein MYCFIDRAFT_61344 [Pseudocercospora fijiensis CIRAD86]EME79552.1 hypothetical protein MYCFIDRAFT_61344 [Pseudocercospora fijiensis CIRAD86]